MARDRGLERYVSNVLVSFVASYRPTLAFFAQKDAAMAKLYPEPFPHWVRGDRHFNLVSKPTRSVIRFEPGRFVVRVEGHPTTKPYSEILEIASGLLDMFGAKDIFGAEFTLVRVHEYPSRRDARTRFARTFLSEVAQDVVPLDGVSDYAVAYTRQSPVSADLVEMKPSMAPLRIKTSLQVGPVDYKEMGQRHCEFTKDADNELYKTPHVAPDVGILLVSRFTLERQALKEGTSLKVLWAFHEQARADSEATWEKVEGAIR